MEQDLLYVRLKIKEDINMEKYFDKLIKELSQLNEVEAIMLSGSAGGKTEDIHSDYDLYIYCSKEIEVEIRKNIIKKYSSYTEINNQFWETEDNFILADENRLCEIIYRDFGFIDATVGGCMEKYYASTGYTTCFWYNLINSKLLFDRNGKGEEYINRFKIEYPKELIQNIINKNYPILKERVSSYYNQIKKAVLRDDKISINHRIAAFLASYFDILFALNEMGHPGEKKLYKVVKEQCKVVPENILRDLENITKADGDELLEIIVSLESGIAGLIKKQGYII